MTDLEATPWVDKTMRDVWSRIAAVVPESWMPLREGRKVKEYGCGHYGCVMPTSEPGLVFKLTTDISEARFVVQAMSLEQPEGIVEYKGIYALKGESRGVGYGHRRPMFVLWRTEAFHVGFLTRGIYNSSVSALSTLFRTSDPYVLRTLTHGVRFLRQLQDEAGVVRRFVASRLQAIDAGVTVLVGGSWGHAGREVDRAGLLSEVWRAYEQGDVRKVAAKGWSDAGREVFGAPKSIRGLQRVGIALNNCRAAAQELNGTPYFDQIGWALMHYLDEGLLLADVHGGNIGINADDVPIITDPGHCVEVHPRWATAVSVKEI